ncbi:hypothetical protein D9M68_460790 [compost metagenome]
MNSCRLHGTADFSISLEHLAGAVRGLPRRCQRDDRRADAIDLSDRLHDRGKYRCLACPGCATKHGEPTEKHLRAGRHLCLDRFVVFLPGPHREWTVSLEQEVAPVLISHRNAQGDIRALDQQLDLPLDTLLRLLMLAQVHVVAVILVAEVQSTGVVCLINLEVLCTELDLFPLRYTLQSPVHERDEFALLDKCVSADARQALNGQCS